MGRITGKVVSGLGHGAFFTGLEWARNQFIDMLGIDPHPGTLNIRLTSAASRSRWQTLKQSAYCTVQAPDADNCDAHCYPVHIAKRFTGAAVVPLLANYPDDRVELISPLHLRSSLSLLEGALLEFEHTHPVTASTVIFDLDGTLLDTVEAFYELARRTGDEFGIETKRAAVYQQLNHGQSYWDATLPATFVNRAATVKQLNARAVQLWPEVMAEHARHFPNIHDTLAGLKAMGATLGIVTGSGTSSLDLLDRAGVRDLFDAVITGSDVTRRKPHPEGLLKCMRLLDATPECTAYVGDTSIDMQASRAAGVTALAVLSGAGDSASLCRGGAHRIVPDHGRLIGLFSVK